MDLLESPENRYFLIKELAKELNAEFYQGTENVVNKFDLNSILQISSKSEEGKNSYIVVGNIESYDYCFIEYFYRLQHGIDRKFKLIIRVKKAVHFLELVVKKDFKSKNYYQIFIGFLGFLIFYLCYYQISNISIYEIIFCGFFSLIGLISALAGIYSLTKINNYAKYGINNKIFREKYVVISSAKPDEVSNFFNEDVCSKIVDLPYDISFESRTKYIREGHNFNIEGSYIIENLKTQVTIDMCVKHLKNIISLAKEFDKETS